MIFAVQVCWFVWQALSVEADIPVDGPQISSQVSPAGDKNYHYHLQGRIMTNFLRSGFSSNDRNYHDYAVIRSQEFEEEFDYDYKISSN